MTTRALFGGDVEDRPNGNPGPRIHLGNVFSDMNRGGAAITIATGRAAERIGRLTSGTLIPDGRSTEQSHPFTTQEFPALDLQATGLVPKHGPARGARAWLRSMMCLLWPSGPVTPRGLTAIRLADVVISKGGYVFVDRASLRSLLSFWQTAFPLIFAARTGATVVTGPTSIGPFAHPIARWVNGIILRSLDLVVARDALSFDEAVRLGVHSDRLALLPDIAFSLAPPTIRDTRLAQEKLKLPALARYACFVLRHDSGTSDPDGILKAQIHAARTLVHEDLVDYIVVARQVPNLISPPETTF
ncbi:MAG: polysaccharide pyruvyl transferase family protein, partial [Acidimicrobiia bacterium]